MSTVDHYESHLASFYSWMFGDFDVMVQRQKELLHRLCSTEAEQRGAHAVAIDLGCGSGFQAIALKQLGYDVHAVDFSPTLLHELQSRDSTIKIRCQDMCELAFAAELNPKLIVCMGDTLTHLSSRAQVLQLFRDVYDLLAPQSGTFVFSYRDLSGTRSELDRFIPVKSDDTRILTCFLEDIPHDAVADTVDGAQGDRVKVFDLLYEKNAETGAWELKKSCYIKLKLPTQWVQEQLVSVGFRVSLSVLPSGLVVVVATCDRLD